MAGWRIPVALAALALVACSDDEVDLTLGSQPAPAAEWREGEQSPLEPRRAGVMAWTGAELLVAGGSTFLCPPGAACAAPTDPPLQDAALLDPVTGAWREADDLPFPVEWASAAVLDGDVYLQAWPDWQEGARPLLRYDVDADRWEELPAPPQDTSVPSITAAGDTLAAYSTDGQWLLEGGAWVELPAAPFEPGYDRTLVWHDPYLYLFDIDPLVAMDSRLPPVARVARLDLGTRTWARLPDSELLSTGPWLVVGDLLVNPTPGSADGGEVNNWGRRYPYGGILDVATRTWSELPPSPADALPGGAFGRSASLAAGGAWSPSSNGDFLDVERREWLDVPSVPGTEVERAEPGDTDQPVASTSLGHAVADIVGAGCHLVAFGGERWRSGLNGELLGETWIYDLPGCAG